MPSYRIWYKLREEKMSREKFCVTVKASTAIEARKNFEEKNPHLKTTSAWGLPEHFKGGRKDDN